MKADEEDRKNGHTTPVQVKANEVVTHTTTIETNLRQGPQACVAPSEIWFRDDLEEVYALLFGFLGYGFRLAMSNVDWHVTQKLVILVPDPIGFAPCLVLLDPGEPRDSCAGVDVDSSPRCGGFLMSHLLSQVHRRQKQFEVESGKGDFVSTKRYWTLPKSCGSQSSEWEERKKSRRETTGCHVIHMLCARRSTRCGVVFLFCSTHHHKSIGRVTLAMSRTA